MELSNEDLLIEAQKLDNDDLASAYGIIHERFNVSSDNGFKAREMRSILSGSSQVCVPMVRWANVIDFLKDAIQQKNN